MPTSLVTFRGNCKGVIVHPGNSSIFNCMECLSVDSRASRGQEICSQHLHSVCNKGRALLSLRCELSVSQVAKEHITVRISCWGVDRDQAVALTSKLTFYLNLLLLIFQTQLLLEQKKKKKQQNQTQQVLLLVQQQHYVCWQSCSPSTVLSSINRFSWDHRPTADAGGWAVQGRVTLIAVGFVLSSLTGEQCDANARAPAGSWPLYSGAEFIYFTVLVMIDSNWHGNNEDCKSHLMACKTSSANIQHANSTSQMGMGISWSF